MENESDDIRVALEALDTGRLDDLSPAQLARLEAYLNEDAPAAASLAEQVPPVTPELQNAVPLPSAEDWQQVWHRIAAATAPAQARPQRPLVLRLWPPVAAAAAVCLLTVGVWTFTRPSPGADWPVEWAHEVEVNALELPAGGTPLVLAAGSEDTIPVIWVIDEGS